MNTEAKILIRVSNDRSEEYSVILFDPVTEGRVEVYCKNQASAETLIAVLLVTGSDVEIQATESINEFAQQKVGEGLFCPGCQSPMRRLDKSSEPEGIRKDAQCFNCGNVYAVLKSGFSRLVG